MSWRRSRSSARQAFSTRPPTVKASESARPKRYCSCRDRSPTLRTAAWPVAAASRARHVAPTKRSKALLESQGGTMANIVKVTTYVTDMHYRVDLPSLREEFFGKKGPASTLIEISALAHPDWLIEI